MPIVAAVVAVVVYFVKNYYSYFFSYDCYLLMKMTVTVRKFEIEIEIVEVMRTAMVKKNLLQDHQMWVVAAVAAVIVYY